MRQLQSKTKIAMERAFCLFFLIATWIVSAQEFTRNQVTFEPNQSNGTSSFAYHGDFAYFVYTTDATNMGRVCRYNMLTDEVEYSPDLFPTIGEFDASHNGSAIAVDGDGYLHVWIGMHNTPINYYKSNTPGSFTDFTNLSTTMPGYYDTGDYTDIETGNDNDTKHYTYPYATTTSNGDVFLIVRRTARNSQTHERQDLYHWDNSEQTWSMQLLLKQHGKNAYMSHMYADHHNNLHIVTAWSQKHHGDNTFQRGTYIKYDVNLNKYYKADGTQVIPPMSVDGTDADLFYPGEMPWGDTTCEIQTPRVTLNSLGNPVVAYPYNTNNYSQNDPDYILNTATWTGTEWVQNYDITEENVVVPNHVRPPISYTGGYINTYFRNGGHDNFYSTDDGLTFSATQIELGSGPKTPIDVQNYNRNTDLYISSTTFNKVVYNNRSNANIKPRVFLMPFESYELTEEEVITLSAEAYDDEPINEVRFFKVTNTSSILIGTVTSPPYTLDWEVEADAVGVRAKVTDAGGLVGSSRRSFTVTPLQTETLTLTASHDSFFRTEGNRGNVNYGLKSTIQTQNTSTDLRESFVLFELPSPYDFTDVRSATLKLYPNSTWATSRTQVYAVANDLWDESTVTFNNKPTVGNAVSSEVSCTSTDAVVTFDITAHVKSQNDNHITLDIKGLDNDILQKFHSIQSNSTSKFPQLELVIVSPNTSAKENQKSTAITATIENTPNGTGAVINIYPNPAKDHLTIAFDNQNSDSPTQISIFNMQGNLIFSENKPARIMQQTINLNTSNLQSGMYIIFISNNNEQTQQKFYKE